MRKLEIKNERVKVIATFYEGGSVIKGDKHGECEGFEIEISVESDEPLEVIQAMLNLAHQMCFTETALSQAIELQVTHRFNGELI